MMRLEAWSLEAERQLVRAILPEFIGIVREQVETGVAQLWHGHDEHSDCYIVTRLERAPLEWCCVCAAGVGAAKFLRVMVAEARRRHLSFRCHVDPEKKGLIRLWSSLGMKPAEIVLRAA